MIILIVSYEYYIIIYTSSTVDVKTTKKDFMNNVCWEYPAEKYFPWSCMKLDG